MLRSPAVTANASLLLLVLPAALVTAAFARHALGIEPVAGPLEELFAAASANVFVGPLVPVVFLGGLMIAFAWNALSIVSLTLSREGSSLAGTFSINLRPRNAIVAFAALTLLAVLAGYALSENAACWFGDQVSC